MGRTLTQLRSRQQAIVLDLFIPLLFLGCGGGVGRFTSATEETVLIEQRVHELVNDYRSKRGMFPLRFSEIVSRQARQHSAWMAERRHSLTHDGFEKRVKEIEAIIPLRGAAENLAVNQGYSDPADEALKGWLSSQGHRENIEGNFNITGVGVAKNAEGEYYFTQIFLLSR